jgi:selenocysteine lyase/cysteine desulfurase
MDFERPVPHAASSRADRFHEGTPPIIGAVQMAAAVSVMEMAGVDTISTIVAERVAGLEEVALRRRAEVFTPWKNPAERAGILSIRLPGEDPAGTWARLAAAGLVVSRRGPWIRLSPHATTGPESVAMLGYAL